MGADWLVVAVVGVCGCGVLLGCVVVVVSVMTDCQTRGCFMPAAVPHSRYCPVHALQVQRVRAYMTEAESELASKPTHTPTDSRIHILSTLREWLRRARK